MHWTAVAIRPTRQAAIFAGQLARRHEPYAQYAGALIQALTHAQDDPLLPQIVWVNLRPFLERDSAQVLAAVKQHDLKKSPALSALLPRITEWLLDRKRGR